MRDFNNDKQTVFVVLIHDNEGNQVYNEWFWTDKEARSFIGMVLEDHHSHTAKLFICYKDLDTIIQSESFTYDDCVIPF